MTLEILLIHEKHQCDDIFIVKNINTLTLLVKNYIVYCDKGIPRKH